MDRALYIFIVLILSGCSLESPRGLLGNQRPSINYEKPKEPPSGTATFDIDGSADDVLELMIEALAGPRFGITHVDRDRGLITAVYQADPSKFVDCGMLDFRSANGAFNRVSATMREIDYQVPLMRKYYGQVNRVMQLDGRVTIQVVQKNAIQSNVTVSGDYVVTRTLMVSGKTSDQRAARRQLMSFSSGEIGIFDDGRLKCQSNGALEQYLPTSLQARNIVTTDSNGVLPNQALPTIAEFELQQENETEAADPPARVAGADLGYLRAHFDRLSCAPLIIRADEGQRTVVSGFVSSRDDLDELRFLVETSPEIGEVDFRISVTSEAFCRFLEITLPLKESNDRDQTGAVAKLPTETFTEGDYITVDITAPNFGSFIYLFYAQQDGNVVHLLPNILTLNNQMTAGQRLRIGEDPTFRRYLVSPPFGSEMMTMIASTQPLFGGLRPGIEPTKNLISDLAAQITAARNAGAKIVADIVFVETRPSRLTSVDQ